MTIKKKLFISNTIMVFVSLLILLAIGGGMIKLFKDEFLTKFSEGSEISSYVSEVESVMMNSDNAKLSMEEWSQKLAEYDFRIYAYDLDGKQIYNNLQHGEEEAVEVIDDKSFQSGEVKMYYLEGSTIVAAQIAQNSDAYNSEAYNLIAVCSPENNVFWGFDRGMFEMFIIIFLVTGILAIGAILICSQLFTKKLIHHIMSPLDRLNDATVRMGEGNLTEPIAYQSEDEFQPVCDSFDQMQENLKNSIEKQAAYEKARTEMVSGISHDLRTPLTSIKGYIKGMMDGIANTEEKRQHYLHTAYKKSCDMDVLLSKLFYFSKLETGNMPFFKQKTDMPHMLENYVTDKNNENINKNVHIELKNDIEVKDNIESESCIESEDQVQNQFRNQVYCDIDQDQTKRVFDNLVENSIKYAKVDDLHIQVKLELTGDQERTLQITFHDNGMGIEQEKLDHVFEQFYRGDESRNSKNDGNGLGLYVCRYIIEQQGGSIEAYSEDGFGVRIELPMFNK